MQTSTPGDGSERKSVVRIDPGFHFRPPQEPHDLATFVTSDSDLFQTIHMGAAVIDHDLWRLDVHGLVSSPYSISLKELKSLPATTITSFHECYGSPLKPPTAFVRRIGNVTWTGVRLSTLISKAGPLPSADFIWSDGLDSGKFASIKSDRYQKDLPLSKALRDEVLVAYEINGEPLDVRRGGPVRLVVPGWFGTNSVKWLCSLALREERSPSPFTTKFYNEAIPGDETGKMRPVWEAESSSIIVSPRPDAAIQGPDVNVWGWAWSCDGIENVDISTGDDKSWKSASVASRRQFEWQRFDMKLQLPQGEHRITARATSNGGQQQPLHSRRNEAHTVLIRVS